MGLDNWLGHGDKEFQFLNLPEKIETEAAKAWAQAGRREQQLLAAEAKSHKAEADLATYRWLATQAAAMLNGSGGARGRWRCGSRR